MQSWYHLKKYMQCPPKELSHFRPLLTYQFAVLRGFIVAVLFVTQPRCGDPAYSVLADNGSQNLVACG